MNILLLDDSEMFHFIFQKTINKIQPSAQISYVIDVDSAINRIGEVDYDIIFVDLDLEHILSGYDFLEIYEQNFDTRKSLIWVLTSSTAQHDKRRINNIPWVCGIIEKDNLTENLKEIFSILT